MFNLVHFLNAMTKGSRVGGRVDQLFTYQGREYAIEFSPVCLDGVMSERFSVDDTLAVFVVVCSHC